MKQIPSLIGWFLVIMGFGLYVFGFGEAVYQTLEHSEGIDPKISEPLEIIVLGISAILATNLGAVLGISITNPNSALASKALFNKNNAQDGTKAIIPPLNSREQIQYIGLLIYLIVLLISFIVWAVMDFKSDPDIIVSLIPQSAKTFMGVLSAYLAFVLGVTKS